MSDKRREIGVILRKKEIADEIFDIWIQSRLLPRPISICEINPEEKSLRLVYRIAGKGTKEFSEMKEGMELVVLGPLGNGFPKKEASALVIGGGIGIPPMLELSRQLNCRKQIILGFRDQLFLEKEFEPYGDVFLATEDGSAGTKGNVLDAISEHGLKADIIYACGSLPMLRALKAYAKEHHMECYVSLEERMACGIGACLGCVCKSKETDSHTNVKNKRICKEGPVFEAQEVDF